jgi:hypothetical protein
MRALRANRLGVDIVLSICLPRDDEAGVYYFASEHSSSSAGKALAASIGEQLGVSPSGRAIPILKNTRSPAVVVALPQLEESATTAIAQGLVNLFAQDE